MPQILSEDPGQLPLVPDQGPVQTVAAHRTHPPLGKGICSRRPRWTLHHLDAGRGEYGVECGGELGVAVTDQIPEPVHPFVKVHQKVAGLLGNPRPGRMGGDPGQIDPPPLNLDDEQDVQPGQSDRLNGEEVTSQQPADLSP